MTDNPWHKLRRKQARDFLDGPAVAAWFRAARQAMTVRERVRAQDIALPQCTDHPVVAEG